jgi:Fe-S oxidoreductase
MNKIDKCSLCGFCKFNCPTYKASLNEKNGPRGRAVMLKNNFSDTSFYNCTLCKACKVECPADVDLELNKVRENLVKKGVETEANKKMIENIRKYGNPFGKLEKGKIPKDLYCC